MNDCFDDILENFYQKKELYKSLQGKIWVSNVLLKLMKDLEEKPASYLRIRNCLIFLLNLCLDIDSPDHCHSKGKSMKELTELEKNNLLDLLKIEFNSLNN
ncbi:MAG: hypothetical protein ACTSRI_10115 [Promethearchaeota archaeon]